MIRFADGVSPRPPALSRINTLILVPRLARFSLVSVNDYLLPRQL